MSLTTEPTTDGRPIEILRPVLGERFIVNRAQLAVCAWFCLFFMYLNYIPLFHSDIWCHVHYGSWMLEHGRLVAEDPFLPLAAGMRVVNTAWLSQLVFALAERIGGPQLISNLFAVVVFSAYLIYARVFYLISGRKWMAILGMSLMLATGWTRHAVVRPEIFGGLFAAALFWMLMRTHPWRQRCEVFRQHDVQNLASDSVSDSRAQFPIWFWIAIPALFALWANMHGSYAVGLLIMACHVVGISLESLWRNRSWRGLLEPQVRSWVWLGELALAATLLNPHGLDLLIETARFGANPNLRDVLEWYPLRMIDFEGIQCFVAVVISFLLVRHSRRKFHPAELLLMTLLAVLTASTVRLIGWLAPIWTISMMPHLTDVWKRVQPRLMDAFRAARLSVDDVSPERQANNAPANESPHFLGWNFPPHTGALLAGLMVWCAFALSPVSQSLLGGKPRELTKVVSKGTPCGVSEFLRQDNPQGIVWTPQWWGDWLAWDGPEQLQVFMTTTLHLAPQSVWKDYMRIAEARPGWQRALDRYAINTIVMDKELQPVMHRAVRRDGNWSLIYEDQRGVVYRRKHLAQGTTGSSAASNSIAHSGQKIQPPLASPARPPQATSSQPQGGG